MVGHKLRTGFSLRAITDFTLAFNDDTEWVVFNFGNFESANAEEFGSVPCQTYPLGGVVDVNGYSRSKR
jgi:hypothetical protein